MMLSVVGGSIVSGQIISRLGKYKFLTTIGIAIVIFGFFLLSKMTVSTTQTELVMRMIITGIGLGLTMPVFTLAVQNAFDYSKLGVVTASSQLFRSVGGVMGVTVLGNLMNSKLKDKLPGFFEKIQNIQSINVSQSQISTPNIILEKIKGAFASSITEIFFIEMIVLIFAFAISFFLKEIPLRKTHDEGAQEIGKELAAEEGNLPSQNEPNIL